LLVVSQVRKMKNRTHMLNKKLLPIVDRKDTRVLEKDLEPKREFVISIRMTPFQRYLYKKFVTLLSELDTNKKLLIGYHSLMRVWNHPACAVTHHHKVVTDQGKQEEKQQRSAGAPSGSGGGAGGGLTAASSAGIAIAAAIAASGAAAAVPGEASASTPQPSGARAVAAGVSATPKLLALKNSSSVSAAKGPRAECNLHYVRSQLDSTYRHFLENSAQLLAQVEQSASQTEEALLSRSAAEEGGDNANRRSGSAHATPVKRARAESGDSDDTGDGTLRSRSSSRMDTAGSDAEEAEGTDADLGSFVVDDDYVEYEDGHVSVLNSEGEDTAMDTVDTPSDAEWRPSRGSSGVDRDRNSTTDGPDDRVLERASKGRRRPSKKERQARKAAEQASAGGAAAAATSGEALAASVLPTPLAAQSVCAPGEAGLDAQAAVEEVGEGEVSTPTADATPSQVRSQAAAEEVTGVRVPMALVPPEVWAEQLLLRTQSFTSATSGGDSSRPPSALSGDTPAGAGAVPASDASSSTSSPIDALFGTTAIDDELTERKLAEAELLEIHTIKSDWWRHTDEGDAAGGPSNSAASGEPTSSQSGLALSSLGLLQLSNKVTTLLSLIALSVMHGDKLLVFSQSLYSLNMIELFLNMPHWDRLVDRVQEGRHERYNFSEWRLNKQYLRIDGSTPQRQKTIDKFNQPDAKFHLMLVSTKAGNMGVNLQAANRVVIFDTSWNPVHDLQAMYRCYRYGQKKPVFVYRLLSAGSMEERIYRLQVKKQSLAARVVDAQMPDNHFSEEELLSFEDTDTAEDLARAEQVLRKGVEDTVLSEFVRHFGADLLTSIEDHGGLLEDKEDEHLTAEEQLQAEEELQLEMKRGTADAVQGQKEVQAALAVTEAQRQHMRQLMEQGGWTAAHMLAVGQGRAVDPTLINTSPCAASGSGGSVLTATVSSSAPVASTATPAASPSSYSIYNYFPNLRAAVTATSSPGTEQRTKAVELIHVVTGELIRIFSTGTEAAEFFATMQSNISYCLHNVRPDFLGFKWRLYAGPAINCKFDIPTTSSYLQASPRSVWLIYVVEAIAQLQPSLALCYAVQVRNPAAYDPAKESRLVGQVMSAERRLDPSKYSASPELALAMSAVVSNPPLPLDDHAQPHVQGTSAGTPLPSLPPLVSGKGGADHSQGSESGHSSTGGTGSVMDGALWSCTLCTLENTSATHPAECRLCGSPRNFNNPLTANVASSTPVAAAQADALAGVYRRWTALKPSGSTAARPGPALVQQTRPASAGAVPAGASVARQATASAAAVPSSAVSAPLAERSAGSWTQNDDELLVLCAACAAEPAVGYVGAATILNRRAQLRHAPLRTPEEVAERHRQLLQSGRDAEIRLLPHVAQAIQNHRASKRRP
jgi:hypothetical protein